MYYLTALFYLSHIYLNPRMMYRLLNLSMRDIGQELLTLVMMKLMNLYLHISERIDVVNRVCYNASCALLYDSNTFLQGTN